MLGKGGFGVVYAAIRYFYFYFYPFSDFFSEKKSFKIIFELKIEEKRNVQWTSNLSEK